MSTAVEVSALSKRYDIGDQNSDDTLRDKIAAAPRALLNLGRRAEPRSIWALRDVSFEVPEGQALGVIGSNGSGKSTLLKVLSRITEPTSGRARVRGRVGALLEVGTGFHPELTGRENIFANGAILGMKHVEIQHKFDAIVDFAGVEQFIDTPVKRYSSGMRLRLAFSVAAHLDPEILIIDEVLAVGDAQFQKRCLGRMNAVTKEGRTILFVSHQLEMVSGLCDRAIWLNKGQLVADGKPADVIRDYISSASKDIASTAFADRTDRAGQGPVRITDIELIANDGTKTRELLLGQPFTIRLAYEITGSIAKASQVGVKLWIEDFQSRRVTCLSTTLTGNSFELAQRSGQLTCHVDRLQLAPGSYRLTYIVSLARAVTSDRIYSALEFDVLPTDFFESGCPLGNDAGVFLTPHRWHVDEVVT